MGIYRRLFLLSSVLIFAACNNGGSSGSDSSVTSLSTFITKIQGNWVSDQCKSLGSGVGSRTTVTVVGGNVRMIFPMGAAGCSGSPLALYELVGTTSDNGSSPTVPVANQISIQLNAAYVTPMTTGLVASYNTGSYCGRTDWALNVAKSIPVGDPCLAPFNFPSQFSDIVSLENGFLYFGNSGRTAMDYTEKFLKQ